MANVLLAPSFETMSDKSQEAIKVRLSEILHKKISLERAEEIYQSMALTYREWLRNKREAAAKSAK